MTYLRAAAEAMGQAGLIRPLVEVCRSAQKEKVFRMALASLRNLLAYDELALASDMVEAGLNKVSDHLIGCGAWSKHGAFCPSLAVFGGG